MEELCEEICQGFEADQIEIDKILKQLKALDLALGPVSSRFVDIDSTVRVDDSLLFRVQEKLSSASQAESLFGIYEALKTYLLIKYKYGEAADWHLKNEFEIHYFVLSSALTS